MYCGPEGRSHAAVPFEDSALPVGGSALLHRQLPCAMPGSACPLCHFTICHAWVHTSTSPVAIRLVHVRRCASPGMCGSARPA